jgi:sarcosine oxidase subunit alpha
MRSQCRVTVNGAPVIVPAGATVAVAVAIAGQAFRGSSFRGSVFRRSVTGEPRGVLCGMGICFECRVAINGTPHCRSCQILCEPGMEVKTDE